MKFTKAELTGKSLEELKIIATECGIKYRSNMAKTDLVHTILDKIAEDVAAQHTDDEPRPKRMMRGRKKTAATQQEDAAPQQGEAASQQVAGSREQVEGIKEQAEVEAPKKRRGRPRKSEVAAEAIAALKAIPGMEELDVAPQQGEAAPQQGEAALQQVEAALQQVEAASQQVAGSREQVASSKEQGEVEAPKKRRGRPRKSDAASQQGDVASKQGAPSTSSGTGSREQVEGIKEQVEVENSGVDFIIIKDIPKLDDVELPDYVTKAEVLEPSTESERPADAEVENTPAKGKRARIRKQDASDSAGAATMVKEQEPAGVVIREEYDFSDVIKASGVLDVMDGYGFLRSSDYNYLSSPDDIFVSPAQIKTYGLKEGDVVEGSIRPPKDGEKFFPLVKIDTINGCEPTVVRDRVPFEYLTPLFPDEKFNLCNGRRDSMSSRIVDLFAPIGKGQRALIVAQPKTGKTLLMKDIANSIAKNHPEAYLMMLLIDERPEEVTDMARTVNAEVIASTFDAPAENHVKIANLVLEKAKRMVECGHDVVIFLDSITRLARAYNTVAPASGKVLTGGVDANALQKPKRFFGAARNIEGGGSLTIIATALIDTGSKMDEVIFEEFKGTGNMELQLDRNLSNKRIFPAVNLIASSTRRDDLLQDENTRRRMWVLRKHISDMTVIEAMDVVMGHMGQTLNNEEFLASMNG